MSDNDVTDAGTTEGDGLQHDETTEPEPKPTGREAGFRHRALTAEGERDALRVRLDARDRRDVEAIALSHGLAVGSDLFDVGRVTLDAVRTPEGEINAEAVRLFVAELVHGRPGLATPQHDGDQGKRGMPQRKQTAPASWGDLLQGGKAG